MKSEGPYYTQCLSGHVFEVKPGGDLEQRCAKRVEEGAVSALVLHASECIECIEEVRRLDGEMIHMISLLGCPLNSCAEKCICPPSLGIADSPYDRQLQYLPAEESEERV